MYSEESKFWNFWLKVAMFSATSDALTPMRAHIAITA